MDTSRSRARGQELVSAVSLMELVEKLILREREKAASAAAGEELQACGHARYGIWWYFFFFMP